jgi:hypothetical protein
MEKTVALFGEAEKGEFRTAYYINSLPQLIDYLGNPPPGSQALYHAIQAIMLGQSLIFFRVEEEGFSFDDYILGLNFLRNKKLVPKLDAVSCPGLSEPKIIEAAVMICRIHNSVLLARESDLYDYIHT